MEWAHVSTDWWMDLKFKLKLKKNHMGHWFRTTIQDYHHENHTFLFLLVAIGLGSNGKIMSIEVLE